MNKFNIRVFFLLAAVSLYLVFKWLPNGQIIAGGDVGIPILDPRKQLNEVLSSWWESHATGISSPVTYTAVPFYTILSIFNIIGIDETATQKGLFFLILFGGSASIFLLALSFHLNKWAALISSLFYVFNLISLSVWQRGVHNGMLMLLLAPLSLLILNFGVKNKRYASIIFVNIFSFLFSYVFGALGFFFSLWLLWTIYIFTMLLYNWQNRQERKFILTFYFLLVVSWVGTNTWWIIHLIQSSNDVLGQFTQEQLRGRGSDVLFGLKPYHNPLYILRGLSAFYHFGVKDWGNFYQNSFILLLSWIPTVVIFYTALSKSNHKNIYWKFLIILTAIILILSKGVNPPLGLLNAWPYDLFPVLAPLRNPYEKIGILLIIPFSLLFAYGFGQIYIYLKSKRLYFLNQVSILIVLALLTILVWPLWLGKIFISEGRKYSVTIPSYYEQANNWLKSRIAQDDSRVLHLPLSWGESIDYKWGYTGIEPSQYFFNGSSIGYQIGVPLVDSRIRDILISVHKQDSAKIQKALASLNIGWVVIHNETIWKPRVLESPDRINDWISQTADFLEHKIDFGPLSIYRVKDQYRLGHFYSEGRLISIKRPDQANSFRIWDEIEKSNDGFLTEIQDKHQEILEKFIEKNIIFPKSKIKYIPITLPSSETALNELTKLKYPENILGLLYQYDRVRECFFKSGRKFKEAVVLSKELKSKAAKNALMNYQQQLTDCARISEETLSGYLNATYVGKEILGHVIRQKAVLQTGFNDSETIEQKLIAKETLDELLANLRINPKFEPKVQDSDKKIISFNYILDKDGEYSLRINNPDSELVKIPPKIIQINDQAIKSIPVEVNEKVIKYPAVPFKKGYNEVQLQTETDKNLIEKSLDAKKQNSDLGFKYIQKDYGFLGEAVSNPVSLKIDLPDLDIEQTYELIFDLDLFQGSSPFVMITYDSDPQDPSGNFKPSFIREIDITALPANLRSVRFEFIPPLNAITGQLAFVLIPSSTNTQSIPTRALIKNIRVSSIFKDDLVLDKIIDMKTERLGNANINWKKVNQTFYTVNLLKQQPPYTLVFSETFHPLWQVTDSAGKKINLPHFSINGFANGWLVENSLPEKVYVKFELQNALRIGGLIAMVVFISSSILFIYFDLSKRFK